VPQIFENSCVLWRLSRGISHHSVVCLFVSVDEQRSRAGSSAAISSVPTTSPDLRLASFKFSRRAEHSVGGGQRYRSLDTFVKRRPSEVFSARRHQRQEVAWMLRTEVMVACLKTINKCSDAINMDAMDLIDCFSA
jgi:hypothetical protein